MNTVQRERLAGIRGAIIDLDGTMLDTAPDFHVAINRMRAEFDLAPLSIDVIKNLVGKGTENLIQCVLEISFTPNQTQHYFVQALTSYQQHYLAINGEYSALYPKVCEGLDDLQAQGIRLACVTNKPIAFVKPLLEKKNLQHYFEIIYGGDSLPKKKPDPMPLLQVCNDFALHPSRVIAIGDSSNDSQAARAAGCPILHVPYGYNHGRPIQEVDSDGIVSTLLDAAHLIFASSSHHVSQ